MLILISILILMIYKDGEEPEPPLQALYCGLPALREPMLDYTGLIILD